MPLYNPTSAGTVADGSITSAKILDGTIATADIASGAVTSALIADGTITTTDISTTSFDARYGKLAGSTWTGVQDFTGATVTGTGGILAYVEYNPGSQTTYTTTSTTLVAIDSTNLVIPTFTAPASGFVVVTFSMPVSLPNSIARWGLVDTGGSTVTGSELVIGNGNAFGGFVRITYSRRVAVTPSASISGWKLAHRASAGTLTERIEASDAATATVFPG